MQEYLDEVWTSEGIVLDRMIDGSTYERTHITAYDYPLTLAAKNTPQQRKNVLRIPLWQRPAARACIPGFAALEDAALDAMKSLHAGLPTCLPACQHPHTLTPHLTPHCISQVVAASTPPSTRSRSATSSASRR